VLFERVMSVTSGSHLHTLCATCVVQTAVLNALGRGLAAASGYAVIDLEHIMRGQERYVGSDGYHWPRTLNLRMFEIIVAHVHNHVTTTATAAAS
jgi:hypothetical protein